MIHFRCDACGRELTVPDERAGTEHGCPRCGKVLVASERREGPLEAVGDAETGKPEPGDRWRKAVLPFPSAGASPTASDAQHGVRGSEAGEEDSTKSLFEVVEEPPPSHQAGEERSAEEIAPAEAPRGRLAGQTGPYLGLRLLLGAAQGAGAALVLILVGMLIWGRTDHPWWLVLLAAPAGAGLVRILVRAAVGRERMQRLATGPGSGLAVIVMFAAFFATGFGVDMTLSQLIFKPRLAEAFCGRGLARLDEGDYDRAIADFSQAIQLKPDLAEAYLNRGSARGGRGDLDGAIADFTEAIRLKPEYAEDYFNAQAYRNRGFARLKGGDVEGAITDCSEAIRLKPDYAMAYYSRGNAYVDKGDPGRAIAEYSKAIGLQPDLVEAYINRGNAYSHKGNHDRAIADFTKAVELRPDLADAYFNRGNAYLDLGACSRAIADYTKAIELNPDYADAYHNRGGAYFDNGDHDHARQDLETAARLDPEGPAGRQARDALQRLGK